MTAGRGTRSVERSAMTRRNQQSPDNRACAAPVHLRFVPVVRSSLWRRARRPRVWFVAALLLACAGSAAPAVLHGQQHTLRGVLERLDTYLESYESLLASVVAEEHYRQTIELASSPRQGGRQSRALVSDYALARSPGGHAWTGFRDTYEVDGQPVRDREERLMALLADGTAESARQALRISRENARFNLGEDIVSRTINVPTVALDLMHPRLRSRFSVEKRGEETLLGVRAWVLEFRERDRPTILRTPQGRDRASRVSAWVDPARGEILRTDLSWAGSPDGMIVVHYRRDDNIGAWVPETMLEEYRGYRGIVTGKATYSDYRRFSTAARIVPEAERPRAFQ